MLEIIQLSTMILDRIVVIDYKCSKKQIPTLLCIIHKNSYLWLKFSHEFSMLIAFTDMQQHIAAAKYPYESVTRIMKSSKQLHIEWKRTLLGVVLNIRRSQFTQVASTQTVLANRVSKCWRWFESFSEVTLQGKFCYWNQPQLP